MRRLALALLALQALGLLDCRGASRGCGQREMLTPLHARAIAIEARSPSVPAERATFLAEGWGAVATARGEPPIDRWPAGWGAARETRR